MGALEIEDAPATGAQPTQEDKDIDGIQSKIPTEDMEEAAFQRPMNSGKKGKGVKLPTCKKPAANVLKKPAQATGKPSTMKVQKDRPKVGKIDYTVTWDPHSPVGKANKNTFCSLHYNRAKKTVKGMPPAKAKAVLSDVFARAGTMWDKHM